MADSQRAKQPAEGGAWRPVLRRMDQVAVASLITVALVGMGVYWVVQGGPRGELIQIDRADPLTARYLVDINTAEWPDNTRMELLANLVFKASDLRKKPFDSRDTPGIDRAASLLADWLADGPRSYREIMDRGKAAGLSKASFDRAKRRMKVLHSDGCWSLPATIKQPSYTDLYSFG